MRASNTAYIENALIEIIQDDTVVKSGYTDEDGKYTTVLGAGTYLIRISKDGYTTIEKTETLNYPSELMVNLPELIITPQRSGAIKMTVWGSVANPVIATTHKEKATADVKKTPNITTVVTTAIS